MVDTASELAVLNRVLDEEGITLSSGARLSEREIASVLANMLFRVTKETGTRLVEVRDHARLAEVGPFKYSGQADTMHAEGLMPDDVYEGLTALGQNRHVGPSYLRVKGLLTAHRLRALFGRQMAFRVMEYAHRAAERDGFVVCVPNMTGGAWIGDEAAKQLGGLIGSRAWPTTPYARETRKAIDAVPAGAKYSDYVEGVMPPPDEVSVLVCFEELRTAAETTGNAIGIHRKFGYREDNGVKVVAASVFDYRHPVGQARLRNLGVDGLYLVGGPAFFSMARIGGHIGDSQYAAGMEWLADPWGFTRKVLPHLQRLSAAAK